MYDKNDHFFEELVQHHISGQLKVAPEHISNHALDKMANQDVGFTENLLINIIVLMKNIIKNSS